MNPRVLLVGDYPPPAGGVAVHVQQLQRYLEGQGVEVKVLDIGKSASVAQPNVIKAGTYRTYLTQLARFATEGWAIHVHTSGNNTKSWMVAASGTVPLGPVEGRLITLHSGLLPAYLAQASARRVWARAALSGYGQIIAVSPAIRDALVNCGVSDDRIMVQPAFCASQVKPGALPQSFGPIRERRAPLLAMAHHPSPVYGRTVMFQALKRLTRQYPDVGLALFGPGTRTLEFEAEARREGVEGLIENLGELDHAQALGVIAASDVFVRPTTADGDSISVREALTLGTACVASDVVARPEGTVCFKSQDPGQLAEQIGRAVVQGRVQVKSPDAGPVALGIYRALLGTRESNEAALGGLEHAANG